MLNIKPICDRTDCFPSLFSAIKDSLGHGIAHVAFFKDPISAPGEIVAEVRDDLEGEYGFQNTIRDTDEIHAGSILLDTAGIVLKARKERQLRE